MNSKSVATFAGAALLLSWSAADAQTVPVQQFGVTAVNSNGDALYNVTVTPNTAVNTGALITGTQTLNTDAAAHGNFFAVARAPNSVTSALDLIVADASKGQIRALPRPRPGQLRDGHSHLYLVRTGLGS